MIVTEERLALLRRNARIERDALLEHRGRAGEDPLVTLASMPDVDEFVVHELRDQLLEDRGQLAEFSLAKLASNGTGPEAEVHRRNVELAEFELLREIGEACPELTVAVWQRAGRLSAAIGPQQGEG